MKRLTITLTAVGAVLAVLAIGPDRIAQAQPAKGALAAYERVLEVMNGRFKDVKLVGDPDRDFRHPCDRASRRPDLPGEDAA